MISFFQIPTEAFVNSFGAPIDEAIEMIELKMISISELMALAPEGTFDPSSHV